MLDPAQHLIDIQKLVRDTEELLAYATPTPVQRSKIMYNALRMSVLAVQINLWYSDVPLESPEDADVVGYTLTLVDPTGRIPPTKIRRRH